MNVIWLLIIEETSMTAIIMLNIKANLLHCKITKAGIKFFAMYLQSLIHFFSYQLMLKVKGYSLQLTK